MAGVGGGQDNGDEHCTPYIGELHRAPEFPRMQLVEKHRYTGNCDRDRVDGVCEMQLTDQRVHSTFGDFSRRRRFLPMQFVGAC